MILKVVSPNVCKRCGANPRMFKFRHEDGHIDYKLYCPTADCETEYVKAENAREAINLWNERNGKND